MNLKTQSVNAEFVAHLMNTYNHKDHGILYVRLRSQAGKSKLVKISRDTQRNQFQFVYFDTLQEAINDARTIARFSPYHCETDILHTPFTAESVQLITEHLANEGLLKAA